MSAGKFAALFAALALSACTWPGYGEGGMDEAYRYERVENVNLDLSDRHARAHRLAKTLDRLRLEIDAAWLGPEGEHRPAGMRMIENHWSRASREWAGDMLDDAEANLSALSNQFRTLRDELRKSLKKAL